MCLSKSNYWKIPGVLFLVMSLIEVIAVTFGYEMIHFYLKPWLVPMLSFAVGLYLYNKRIPAGLITLIILALFFHTLGDIFLLFNGLSLFICGIVAFMIGHLFYITILQKEIKSLAPEKLPVSRVFIENFITIVIPVFMGIMLPQGNIYFTLLVCLYAYVLLTIARLSLRWISYKIPGGKAAITGILIFIISDGLIALHQFIGIDFSFRHTAVMGTYLLAQALITFGLCRGVVATTSRS